MERQMGREKGTGRPTERDSSWCSECHRERVTGIKRERERERPSSNQRERERESCEERERQIKQDIGRETETD